MDLAQLWMCVRVVGAEMFNKKKSDIATFQKHFLEDILK